MNKEERAALYAEDIAKLIRIPTITGGPEEIFAGARAELYGLFPRLMARCGRQELEGGILLRLEGEGPGNALLLMSHHDVVEAGEGWTHPPFGGEISEGRLWGRGALDVKGNLYCILRALDELCAEGFTPPHDVYVASSNMEETGGNDLIADYLESAGAEISLLVDEGSPVSSCRVAGIPGTFASISVAEKGYMDVKCVARGRGGHSSAPGRWSPLPRLGAFMCDIEREGLLPPRMNPAHRELYRRLAEISEGGAAARLQRISESAEGWLTELSDFELASISTTAAFTMAAGSGAANVLPQEAYVVCNIRIAPGVSSAECLEAMQGFAARRDIELELMRVNEPSPVTDPAGMEFRRVEAAVNAVYPGVTVLPFLLSGGTDTKHFTKICPNCLRFTPMLVSAQQSASVHGIDENIDVSALPDAVDFFKALIKNS